MADKIVRQVKVFHDAFQAVWAQVEVLNLSVDERRRAALMLRDVIQAEVKSGADDPNSIATRALESLRQRI